MPVTQNPLDEIVNCKGFVLLLYAIVKIYNFENALFEEILASSSLC